jgi:polar amino acid transport system substrate-binding protein
MDLRSGKLNVVLFFLLIFIFSSICSWAAQDNHWQKIKEKDELVIGFCAQYPPFEFKTSKGEFKGFDVDLGNQIGKYLNIPVKFKDGEWQGLIAGMNKGDYDMLITCMSKTNARKNNANFSDPYYDHPEVIVVRKDESKIKAAEDLADKVVGVQMSTSSEKTAESLMPELCKEIKKYNYTTEAFLDLKYKRIDAVICGHPYAIMQIKKDPSYKFVGEPLNKSDIVMVMPKGADTLTQKINQALASLKDDGTYDKLYSKWLLVE